ncbi:MAG: cupin domain-containing protein [Oryzihumus sp.]
MKQRVVSDSADSYPATFVSKPWGREMIFAEIDDLYVGKVLYVDAGESLSLQLHTEKTETICVIAGRGRLEFGADAAALECATSGPGEAVHLAAGVLHRLIAEEESRPGGGLHGLLRLERGHRPSLTITMDARGRGRLRR